MRKQNIIIPFDENRNNMKYLLKRTKKILFVTFFLVQAICIQAQSNTHTGDITVSTQAAVDALSTTLAGKTRINGNLTIGYYFGSLRSNITDLTPLRNITHITGNLRIQLNEQLVNLNPLTNLQSIGGYFNMRENDRLTTLGDFPDLQTIGGYFLVFMNAQLTTLDFPALQTIGEYFFVWNNDRLTTLDFSALTSIGEGESYVPSKRQNRNGVSIVVEENSSLSDCYVLTDLLPGGTHAVSGEIYINNNAGVCTNQSALSNTIYRGNITVTTQAAVDALRTTLSGKTIIAGNLIIGYTNCCNTRSDITDLTPLSNITDITGYVHILQNGQLDNLTDLNNLQSIGGYFYVDRNNELTNLGDFPVLQSIGGYFRVRDNIELTDLGDFPVLQSIGEYFSVYSNSDLTNLGDFPVLQSIGGYFTVNSNDDLTNLGDFPVLQSIGGKFFVGSSGGNSELTDLGDFPVLQTIGGYFWVRSNIELTDLGDFPVLQTIGGYFRVDRNNELTNLGDFPVLQSIGGYFYVGSNDTLTTLGNFSTLTSIGVGNNVFVPSLGYRNSVSIVVEDNSILSTCCVLTDFLSDGVDAVSGDIYINNNATGCNSESEINATTLTLTSSNESIAYNDTDSIAIDFTVGCGSSDWTSAITYTPANANFITLSSTERTGQTGAITLMATPTENTGVERTATITLSTTGGASSQTIIITQAGAPHTLSVSSTSPSTNDSINISSLLTTVSISVDPGGGATGWTSTSNGGFISLNSTRSTSTSTRTVIATISRNSSTSSRSGTITFTSTGSGTKINKTLTITQSPPHTLSVSSTPSSTNGRLNINSSSTTVSISVDPGGGATGWTSTNTGSSFISLNSTRSTSTSATTVTATISGNSSVSSRSGTITFISTGSGTKISKTLTITQSPPHTLSVSSTHSSTNDSINISSSSLNVGIKVEPGGGATGWTSTHTRSDFITLSITESKSTSTKTVIATIKDNLTVSSRSGTITFISTGFGISISKTLTITQAAVPDYVYVGDITVTTQAEVDTLKNTLAGKTKITGNLTLGDTSGNAQSDITDLTPLSNIIEVMGNVIIQQNAQLVNLNGLNNLQTIGGAFEVHVNGQLTTLGDFTNLKKIKGYFNVNENDRLTTLDFPFLQTIGEYFNVNKNDRLTTLDFPELQSIGINFSVNNNAQLTTLGNFSALENIGSGTTYVPSLGKDTTNVSMVVENNTRLSDCYVLTEFLPGGTHAVSGGIYINNNASVCSNQNTFINTIYRGDDITVSTQAAVDTLRTTLVGKMTIRGNLSIGYTSGSSRSNITDLTPLSHVTHITGNITIRQNGQLVNLTGLDSLLQTVGGEFYVGYNDSLTTLGYFQNLQSIGKGFIVTNNNSLTNFGYFPNLQSMGGVTKGGFVVQNNSKLTTLDNFPVLTSTGLRSRQSIVVENNSSLSDCCVLEYFISQEENMIGKFNALNPGLIYDGEKIIFITDNATGCENRETIQNTCQTLIVTTKKIHQIARDNTDPIPIKFYVGGSATGWTSEITYTPTQANFITLSPEANTNQTDTITITATPTANTGVARSATIRITTMGGVGYAATATVTITQAAAPPSLVLSSPSTVMLAHDASTAQTITFTVGGSASGWASSMTSSMSGENFITLNPAMNDAQTGGVTVTATPSGANTSAARSATITFTTSGGVGDAATATVTITQEEAPVLSVDSSSLSVGHDVVDAQNIVVSVGGSATEWKATTSDSAFVTITTSNGVSGGSATFTLISNDTESERTAEITITTNGSIGSDSAVTVMITQEAKPTLTLTSDINTFGHDVTAKQTITFNVGGSATEWEASTPEGFVNIKRNSGNSSVDSTTFTLDPNNTGSERTEEIVITTDGSIGSDSAVTVMITQEEAPTITLSTSAAVNINYDVTDAQTITFNVGGSAKGWKSDIVYSAGTGFITLTTAMNANQRDEVTLMATPDANTGAARTATITFSTTGQLGDSVTAQVTITQGPAPNAPTLELTSRTSGDTVKIDHDMATATDIAFMVGGNATGWSSDTVYSPVGTGFITLDTVMNADQTGYVTVTATPTSMNRGVERSATITISTSGPAGTRATVTLTITQGGAPPILRVSTMAADTIGHNLRTSNITFTVGGGAMGWMAASSDDNVILFPTSGNSGTNIGVEARFGSENTTGEARTATITITTRGGTGDAVTETVMITQEAEPTLSVSTMPVTIGHDSLTSDITFTVGGGAMGWTATSSDDSVTLSSMSGDLGENTVRATFRSANTTRMARTAIITIMTTGRGTRESTMVTLIQEMMPEIRVTSINGYADSIESISIAHDATDSIPIKFYVGGSATGWGSVNTNSDFITLFPKDSIDQKGNGISIMATPSANENTIPRTATITLSTTGQKGTPKSVSLTITQEAIPVLQITSKDTIIIHDATDSIPIKFYVGGSATGWTSANTNFNFITLSTSNTDTGAITIMARPSANTDTTSRTATIILSTTGHIPEGASVSDTFTITQKAAPDIKLTSPGDTLIAHDDTLPKTIKFFVGGSATGWESEISYMPETDTFITLSTEMDTTQTDTVIITATPSANENTTPVSRKAIIKLITTGPGETPNSDSLTITQESRPTIMLTSHSDGNTIDIAHDNPESIIINFMFGGSATGWKNSITYPPDTPKNDEFINSLTNEGDNGFISITPKSKNTDTASRTANIKLSTTGQIGDSVSVSLTIRQEGKPALDLFSNRNDTIAYDANTTDSIPITFFVGGSAEGWESKITYMPEKDTFITLSSKSNIAETGDITIMASPSANDTTVKRTAMIMLSTTGKGEDSVLMFTITQEAVPTITLNTYSNGGNNNVLVSLNSNGTDIIKIAHDDTQPRTINFTVGGNETKDWTSAITYDPENDTSIIISQTEGMESNISFTPLVNKNIIPRTATIKLSTTGQKGTPKSVSLTVTQEAIPVLQITSNDSPTIIHDETDSIPIKFYVGGSATGWTSMNNNFNFVTLDTTMNDNQTDTVTIMAIPEKNSDIEERTDTIILSTIGHIDGGASVSDIFTITQKAAPRIMLTDYADGENVNIAHDEIMHRTISFTLKGSASGITYMPPEDTSFITLDMLNDGTRAITITPTTVNTTTEERTETITLRTTGSGGTPDSVSLTITQEAMPTIMLSSYNDGDSLLEADGYIIVIAHDHMSPIPIKFMFGGSATDWKDSITYSPGTPPNFIKSESLTNEGTNGSINITPKSKNTDTTSRTAIIKLRTTGQDGTPASVSLTIRQEGKPALDPISNHNDIIAYDATDSIPIKFFVGGSAKGWESVNTNPDFITLFPNKDTAQTDTITIMASPSSNDTTIQRMASITLRTTGQIGDPVITMFTITQEAVPTITLNTYSNGGNNNVLVSLNSNGTDIIKIAHDDTQPRTINFTVGGNETKDWTSAITYDPENDTSIIISQTEGMESNISFTPLVNKNIIPRTATIKLSTTGQKGTPKSVSLTITQEAIPVLQITSNDSPTIIHDETDSIPIKFYVGGSATGWTSMNNNFNFVTLDTTMNDNQTDTVTIMAIPEKNSDIEERTDTIILSTIGHIDGGASVSDIFTITQKAAPRIMLTDYADGENVNIAHDEIMHRTISFTLKGSASGITYMPPEDTSFITLDMLNDGTRAITITPTTVNTTTEERTETITLRTTGSGGTPDSVSLTITQEAMPTIMLTSRSDGETITIAHDAPKSITLNFLIGGSATYLMSTISYIPKGANFISTLIPTTNDNNDTISIKVSPNSDNLSNTDTESRTATITLSTTGQKGTADSVSLTIRQEGVPTLTLTSSNTVTLDHDATTAENITFSLGGSATGWSAMSSNTDFIKVPSTRDVGMIAVRVVDRANTTGSERTSTITITTRGSTGSAVSKMITITQEAVPTVTLVSAIDTIGHDVSDVQTIKFNVGGSATGWMASATGDFVTIRADGNLSVDSTTFTLRSNQTGSDRTSEITITTMGRGSSVSKTVTITQEAMPTVMLVSDVDIIGHDVSDVQTIKFNVGGSAMGWMASAPEGFVTILKASGNSSVDSTTFILSSNETGSDRTSEITITTMGRGSSVSETVMITQEASPMLTLTSLPGTIGHDVSDVQTIKFNVGGSATGWMASAPEDFVIITKASGNSPVDSTTFTLRSNQTGSDRTSEITITTMGRGSSVSETLTITQEAVPTIEVNAINSHADSTESISIAHDATDSIPIEFDVEGSAKGWESKITYTGNSGFITLSTKKDTAEIGAIAIKASPMKNIGVERTDTITLSTTGQKGTPKSVSLTITQEAIPVLEITSKDATIIHDETDSIPINFNVGGSAKGWENNIVYTLNNANFITLSPKDSIDQKGNITIMAKPEKNPETTSRTATIILSTKGHMDGGASVSDTFTITQKAAPRITLTSHSDRGNIDVAHDDTIPRTISFALGGSATGWKSSIIDTASFITLGTLNDGTRAIEITPKVNTTTEERTATITLRTMGEGTPDSVSLAITQEARPTIMLTSHTNADSLLNPDGDIIDIAHNHTSSIPIEFNVGGSAEGWEIEITDTDTIFNFVTLFPEKNMTETGRITIEATPVKNNGVERTDTITLRTTGQKGTADSVLLTITQEGKPVLELISHTNDENIKIVYDNTDSIPITFNVGGSAKGWESEIIDTANFITLSPEKDKTQTSTITIMAIPMENPDIRERTTTITLRTTGQIGTSKSVSLTITQKAAPTIKLISIDSISIAYDNTDPIPINFFVGGSATGWESEITYANTDSTFITLDTKINAGQISDITIEATSSANEDTIPRTATITLSTTGQEGDSVSVSLIITQEAKPVLQITSNDTNIAHDATDSIPIHFNVGGSATGWNSEITYTPSDANFVTLSSEESMDQTGPITIMASPSANTDLRKRTATIILSTEGNGASVKDTLTITQAAAPEIKMTTSHTNGENIKIAHNDTEPIPLNFTLKGSAEGWRTDTIIYTPENADFITSPQTTDEADDTIFTQITPKVNTTTEERTATIRLKTTGHEGTPDSVSLTITQEAMPVIELISKKTDTIIHDATDSIPINFTVGGSAKGWISVNSNSDFITLSPKDSITQTGNITIMASPTENTDNKDRIATITLSTTGQIGTPASAVFTIIQKAKPTIILRDRNNSSIQKDHTTPIVIRFTVSGSAKGWASHIDYMPDSANFITLNPPNNDATGNITIRAEPSANTSAKRTATIILITAGHEGTPDSVLFTITQDAGAELLLGVAPSKPFTLYPNPTNGTLTIEGVTGYLQMYIYDLVGREVMTYSLTPSKKTIDVSDLPSGMYVITLRGKGKTWKEILMKK